MLQKVWLKSCKECERETPKKSPPSLLPPSPTRGAAFHTPVIDMQDGFHKPITGEMPRLKRNEPGAVSNRNRLIQMQAQSTRKRHPHSAYQSLTADGYGILWRTTNYTNKLNLPYSTFNIPSHCNRPVFSPTLPPTVTACCVQHCTSG